jgi:hypothetical protein
VSALNDMQYNPQANVTGEELAITLKKLIAWINESINTARSSVDTSSIDTEKSHNLGKMVAYTDCLREILFDAFDGSWEIYRQLIESGEIHL